MIEARPNKAEGGGITITLFVDNDINEYSTTGEGEPPSVSRYNGDVDSTELDKDQPQIGTF